MTTLPIKPESIEQLRARFPQALEGIYHSDAVAQGGDRPGNHRRHIFDFPQGMRLIISRDRLGTARACLHVSASFSDALAIEKFGPKSGTVKADIVADGITYVLKEFAKLTDRYHLKCMGMSDTGVLHFVEEA